MFSHVTIGTNDLPRAIAFYDAALSPLGIARGDSPYVGWAVWRRPGETAALWVGKPFDKSEAHQGNGWMVAFTTERRSDVDAAYAAAMAAGGTDDGPPGKRDFGPTYYGAYVRDPDRNKVHFVCRAAE